MYIFTGHGPESSRLWGSSGLSVKQYLSDTFVSALAFHIYSTYPLLKLHTIDCHYCPDFTYPALATSRRLKGCGRYTNTAIVRYRIKLKWKWLLRIILMKLTYLEILLWKWHKLIAHHHPSMSTPPYIPHQSTPLPQGWTEHIGNDLTPMRSYTYHVLNRRSNRSTLLLQLSY